MCVSKLQAVDDPVEPVRHGDIIQLIHGMTHRPLNRCFHSLGFLFSTLPQVRLADLTVCIRISLEKIIDRRGAPV